MPMQVILMFRVPDELREAVEEAVVKSGLDRSKLLRGTIGLAFCPKKEPNQVELIIRKVKAELEASI